MSEFDATEQIDLNEHALEDAYAPRVFNASLSALRAQNPFIPMLPWPGSVIAGKLVANAAQDIQLPEGTKMIRMRGENGKDYWVTRNGAAQIPGTTPDPLADRYSAGAMMTPNDRYFYTEDIRQLSMIAAQDTLFSIECFIQL